MSAKRICRCFLLTAIFLTMSPSVLLLSAQDDKKSAKPGQNKKTDEKQPSAAKTPTETEELQQAISSAGTDRAALVRNLEAHLTKYPESAQRPQIYRAFVEASLQLRDTTRAADYAERVVALTPDDMSITLVAIQLLQQSGDEAGL